MIVYIRLGPIVLIDADILRKVQPQDPQTEPPPQLAGGQGAVIEPSLQAIPFGFVGDEQ